MFSEALRQQAMRYAVDKDVAGMTKKVKLIQETYENAQAGILMYLPIYREIYHLHRQSCAGRRWKDLYTAHFVWAI